MDLKLLNQAVIQELDELQGESETDFVEEIINIFLSTSPFRVSKIKSAIEKNNIEQTSKEAHGLKSSARTLGTEQLAHICQEIEDLQKSTEIPIAKVLFEKMEKTFALTCNELNKIKDNRKMKKQS